MLTIYRSRPSTLTKTIHHHELPHPVPSSARKPLVTIRPPGRYPTSVVTAEGLSRAARPPEVVNGASASRHRPVVRIAVVVVLVVMSLLIMTTGPKVVLLIVVIGTVYTINTQKVILIVVITHDSRNHSDSDSSDSNYYY